jgi:hypothetical protein
VASAHPDSSLLPRLPANLLSQPAAERLSSLASPLDRSTRKKENGWVAAGQGQGAEAPGSGLLQERGEAWQGRLHRNVHVKRGIPLHRHRGAHRVRAPPLLRRPHAMDAALKSPTMEKRHSLSL